MSGITSPSLTPPTAVQWAAQADLVLLTVEMLRPPVVGRESNQPPAWTGLSRGELNELLSAAGLPDSTVREGTTLQPKTTLREALHEVFVAGQALEREAWVDEYWRLFDSSMACPITEAAYVRRDKGAILGDAAGFYAAFGWQHDPRRGERPDHLLCQLEFVAALLAMASRAGDAEQRQVTAAALADFARDHLHDWLPSFAWQLCEGSQLQYFGAVAAWLVMLWDALSARHNWPADKRATEPLTPQVETENPYECAANGLVQIGEH